MVTLKEAVSRFRQKYVDVSPKEKTVDVLDEDGVVTRIVELRDGQEFLDPTPIDPPIGYTQQPSMHEYVRELIRSERLRQEAEEAGLETFDEADDFETDEGDIDPLTPYEGDFDPIDYAGLREAIDEEKAKSKKGAKARPERSNSEDEPGSQPKDEG